ncbi:MAG: anaerobic glycerol-3-phosphate dehydrogenase subunit C [Desulfovibrio sp.]|nr:anaerobic glycerol-3-phosphate dehydrogenase subunit C [Desulfovibrio sp.]
MQARKAAAAWRFARVITPPRVAEGMTDIAQPDRCIVCTTCTVMCPVAKNCLDFLGPRMIGPAHQRFRLLGMGEDESLHYCSNCKNCDISCPCDVPVSTFIMRARAEASREKPPKFRDWILAHGELLACWLRFIPAVFKNFGMGFAPVRLLLHALGIARQAPLPAFAAQTFRRKFKSLSQPQNLPRQVVLFPGCFVDIYEPESGLDIVAVLNRAGYEAITPEGFVCCGLPLVANGFWQNARQNARRNLEELARWTDRGLPVLTACPSCALMFGKDYAEYFPDLLPRNLSPVLVDVCEFLTGCMERGELSAPDVAPGAATTGDDHILYHAPCHLRALGAGLPGLELLRLIPGLRAEYADSGCCGISGSYGFKKDKYAIGMRVGSALFSAMRQSDAKLCASECGTCRVQMRHGGGKQTLHPVSILRRWLDGK